MEEKIYELLLKMQSDMCDMRAEQQEHFQRIEKRLDAVEQKLDAVEHRLDTVEQRLDAVEQRLDTLEQRFDALEERVEALEEKMDILDAREDRHYELLQASIGDSYHGLKSIHSTMYKQVERLDEKKVDKEALRSIC